MAGIFTTLNRMLPKPISEAVARARQRQRFDQFAQKTRVEAFNEVYSNHLWDDSGTGEQLSGEGSYGA